ncbi:MAG: hypothetical protein GWM87_13380 [Xanthomonadales bacterium]|nr:hypothetical protein [Xanthomonadales bacterium]NIX13811.1 hypothetical protein [Xanthomonadales bacterium]
MRADFRLGEWIVRPRRDCIERGDETVHIHPRPMAVLLCLAEAGGEVVTRDELFEAVWPGVIVTDDALTQCIVELRKAFSDSAREAKYIQTVPKVGFRLVPSVSELDGEVSPGGIAGKKWLVAAGLAALVAVVLLVATVLHLNQPEHSGEEIPIAVMPFKDMSQNQDQEWFADGLSEELIISLGRVDGLLVPALSSTSYFKGANEDPRVIGAHLDVGYLLDGSVRRDGERLRIAAQLIDASSGLQLWSEAYDRQLENIIEVQVEITEAIVGALEERLGLGLGMESQDPVVVNKKAYEALQRGRFLLARREPETAQLAVREFARAIALDPDYAMAHAELAIAYLVSNHFNLELNWAELKPLAMPHAERAMALDPNLAEAWAAMSWFVDSDEEKIAYLERAIQLNRNYSIGHTWLARELKSAGREQEMFPAQERAVLLNPFSITGITNYIYDLVDRCRMEDAKWQADKFEFLAPDRYARFSGFLDSVGGQWSAWALGSLEALQINPETRSGNRVYRTTLARLFAVMGLASEALTIQETPRLDAYFMLGMIDEAVAREEERFARNPDSATRRRELGLTLATAGDFDRAKPFLEELWQRNDGRLARSPGRLTGHQAIALAVIRRAAGDEAGAEEALAAMREYVSRLRDAGVKCTTLRVSVDYLEGITVFLSGEREEGLALIARSVEDGAFWEPNTAYLQSLYDDPGFAPIMALQRERQKRERRKFLDAVCYDNPYNEVWQPSEETCEEYLPNAGG